MRVVLIAVLTCVTSCGARTGLLVGDVDADAAGDADVVDTPTPVDAGPPLRVFVTDRSYVPDFGGLEGADGVCAKEAAAAGIAGRFLAWLSDSSRSPATRFAHPSRSWARLDGVVVATDWADLTDGSLDAPIEVTSTGVVLKDPGDESVDVFAWTATLADGTAPSGKDCPPAMCTCND